MFEKSSLRTRLSFYLAIKQLGGGTITLRSNELHLGEGGESLEDTAKNLIYLWRWVYASNRQ
jgi:ornithine carbamoyltransferase